jgi:A/G-specific adenine glycosylase
LSSAPCSRRRLALLDWYGQSARDLPWRHTDEPYAIWLSEIMLQQTQVKTVLPRYMAWLQQFPDIATLAAAEQDHVLKAWEGLGYYRRARFLHAAARQVVQAHGGRFPDTFADIMALPGIGRSTAGAIASFCFGMKTPVLDGNVKRVLKRWYGQPEAKDAELWQLAETEIEAGNDPASWNQAMMELGATCCAPRVPACENCPVQAQCASAFNADVDIPRSKKTTVQNVHWQVHLHTDPEHGIWLQQRPASGIWASLWSPPITELEAAPDVAPCHVHLLSHRRLHLYGLHESFAPASEGRWVTSLEEVAVPTGMRRLLQQHGLVQTGR